jgi:hypothetical protein
MMLQKPDKAYPDSAFERLKKDIANNEIRERELVAKTQGQTIDVEQVMNDMEGSLTDAMKARLEARYFGLTLSVPHSLSRSQASLCEVALEKIAQDFEQYFGDNIEIVASVLAQARELKFTMGVTNLPLHMGLDQIKEHVSVTLRSLPSESSGHLTPTVRVRLKVGRDQMPERLSIDMTYVTGTVDKIPTPDL